MNNKAKRCVNFVTIFGASAILGALLMVGGCGGGGGSSSSHQGNVVTSNTGAVISTTALPDAGDAKNSMVLSDGTVLKDASGNVVPGNLTATVSYSTNAADLPSAVQGTVPAGNTVAAFLDITIINTANGQTVKTISPPMAVKMDIPGRPVGSTVDIYTTNSDGTGRQLLQAGLTVDANNQVSFTLGHLTIVAAEVLPTSPASITADNKVRSAVINTAFADKLEATVRDSGGNPVSGVTVTFSAPSSGASGTFAGGVATATTNASGVAESAVFTANGIVGSYTVNATVAGVTTPAHFTLSNVSAIQGSITASAGTPQSTAVNTAFGTALQATVRDSGGNPVSGATVTFTAPATGASGTFAGGVTTATTNASGVATAAIFTANGTPGSYTVTATVAGVVTPASFALTNLPTGSSGG